jgi:hypothetical protein
MLDAVQKAGVKHMVAFNYRFVPAIRQMRKLIESGALGRIYHFRAVYLQEWIMPHYNMPMIWRSRKMWPAAARLGDLGAHIIDLGHYLVGEVDSVSAMTKTFIPERPWGDGTMGKLMWTTPLPRSVSLRTARLARSRRRALPPGARTATSSRSTPKGQPALQPGADERD